MKSVNGINVNSRLLAIRTLIKPVARQDVSFCVDPRQTPMATGEFLGFIEKASHFFQPSIARALLKVCSHSSPIPLPFLSHLYYENTWDMPKSEILLLFLVLQGSQVRLPSCSRAEVVFCSREESGYLFSRRAAENAEVSQRKNIKTGEKGIQE